jgi:hypothetical protein
LHAEKKLGGWVRVRGDEKEAVTAKLLPLGAVMGKIVDSDGRPITGVSVSLQFPDGPGGELYREVRSAQPPVVTDEDGAFRIDGIVPSVKFTLSLVRGREYFLGEPRIGQKQMFPAQTLDLGSLTVKAQKFGE